MTKSLRWRIPLIAVVIAIGLMVLYPPADKVLKRELVKEVDGKVVESTTLESSLDTHLRNKPGYTRDDHPCGNGKRRQGNTQ